MSNYFKNRYYSSDNKDFVSIEGQKPTDERMKMIKKNNQFILTVFSNMISSNDFMNTALLKKYEATILAGDLPKTDKVTGYNTNKLGEKLKFLVMAAADKSHPENMENFKNSFFVQSLLIPIYHGGFMVNNEDSDERWTLYDKTGVDKSFKNVSPLNGAFKCYVNDPNTPVGLDLSTLIDAIVKEDEKGNYQLVTDINDINVKNDMVSSVKEFIDLLKSNKRFKDNYKNPKIIEMEEDEEYEDEDE